MLTRILTVPMSPEFLPEAVLLLAGVLAVGVALRYLFTRRVRGGLGIGAAGIACIALAFVLGRSGCVHSPYWGAKPLSNAAKPPVLVPASIPDRGAAADSSMTLVLGHVIVHVAPADRYVLSVDGRQFLALDSLHSGLLVSCTVGTEGGDSFYIGRNAFLYTPAGIQPERPDDHTILVQARGKEVFKIYYAEPRRIEITGQIDNLGGEPVLMLPGKGIRWSGGGVPPGTSIDLTPQGRGRIDFQRSGLIQVIPYGGEKGSEAS
jgi:hypothetical protein